MGIAFGQNLRAQSAPMLQQPLIDPVALALGPVKVHWYGLTYLLAFTLFYLLALRRLRHQPYPRLLGANGQAVWTRQTIEDLLFYGMLGVILGGRFGYCLFYKPLYYLHHPLEILMAWQGGMSFHGGMLGVLFAMYLFARKQGRSFWEVTDFIAPCVPTGLAAGRIGNFINGELWGRVADPSLPWAMVFRDPAAGGLPRHPSSMYQFLGEGLLLFVLLWWYAAARERKLGEVSALFLVGYGLMRFVAEYFRQPDAHLGFLTLGLSMGQWLCVPMIVLGLIF
ncbi:unnamed protein product, partial [Darwinula stevensoni]